jgi:hypothetical protein
VDWARLAANTLVIVVGTIATVLLVDFYAFLGLGIASVALAVAAVFRSVRVAAAIAIGSGLFAVLVLLAVSQCDLTVEDCSASDGVLLVLAWLVALAATAALTAFLNSRRKAIAQ